MVTENRQAYSVWQLALQLYGRSILVGMMCFFLYMSVSYLIYQSVWINIICQVVFCLLLGGICYDRMWKQGDSDRNAVNFGRRKEEKCRGLYVGLIANIPATVVYVGLVLNFLGIGSGNYLAWYRILNFAFAPTIFNVTVAPSIIDVKGIFVLGLAATLLLLPASCGIGYLLGYHQYSLSDHLIYSGKGKKNRRS